MYDEVSGISMKTFGEKNYVSSLIVTFLYLEINYFYTQNDTAFWIEENVFFV